MSRRDTKSSTPPRKPGVPIAHACATGWKCARRLIAVWVLAVACVGWLSSSERVYTQGAQDLAGQSASWAWRPTLPSANDGQVHVLPVRGHVYMLVGAGGNITVHAGDEGVLLVDTGVASMSEKVLAAVRTISQRPLRYIIDTNEREEHTGGNEIIAAAGETIPFRLTNPRHLHGRIGSTRASVISFLTVFHRMSAPTGQVAPTPEAAWPDNTYSTPQKKLYFNDEPVLIMHQPSNTDGNSIVHFRLADVVSVGDLVDLTAYRLSDVLVTGNFAAVKSFVEPHSRL